MKISKTVSFALVVTLAPALGACGGGSRDDGSTLDTANGI